MNTAKREETAFNLLRAETALKEIIPLLVRVSDAHPQLNQNTLGRLQALRDALFIKNAPPDNASLDEWMRWSTIR